MNTVNLNIVTESGEPLINPRGYMRIGTKDVTCFIVDFLFKGVHEISHWVDENEIPTFILELKHIGLCHFTIPDLKGWEIFSCDIGDRSHMFITLVNIEEKRKLFES